MPLVIGRLATWHELGTVYTLDDAVDLMHMMELDNEIKQLAEKPT